LTLAEGMEVLKLEWLTTPGNPKYFICSAKHSVKIPDEAAMFEYQHTAVVTYSLLLATKVGF